MHGADTIRARAMWIGAGLPTYLWNELIKTAEYIANQTLMQKHNWKTPFEMVIEVASNLSHLRKDGCKAYALDKHIPYKQKLKKRAYIGHLMGYDSTNIIRIWIPSQQKIIRTRDAQFDKNSFYDSAKSEPDLSQIAMEPMMQATTYAISFLDLSAQIMEIESDEDEWELNFLAGPRSDSNLGPDTEGENDDYFHDASTGIDEFQPDQTQLLTPNESELSSLPSLQLSHQTLPKTGDYFTPLFFNQWSKTVVFVAI